MAHGPSGSSVQDGLPGTSSLLSTSKHSKAEEERSLGGSVLPNPTPEERPQPGLDHLDGRGHTDAGSQETPEGLSPGHVLRRALGSCRGSVRGSVRSHPLVRLAARCAEALSEHAPRSCVRIHRSSQPSQSPLVCRAARWYARTRHPQSSWCGPT